MKSTIQLVDFVFVVNCVLLGMLFVELRSSTTWLNGVLLPSMNDHLGAEYDCIARALRAGRGFADPFQVESGPTAWMPPVLPCVLAGLYWITGDNRSQVVEIVLVLKGLVLISSGMILVSEGRRLRMMVAAYVIFPVALAANFFWFFQVTHDEWWLLLVVNALWIGFFQLWKPRLTGLPTRSKRMSWSVEPAILWGSLGGIAALSSPILGAVWAMITSGAACSAIRNGTWCLRPWFVAAVVSIAVVTPWTIRNRIVMGAWLPIKSNGAFELWQSQCLGTDGVVDVDVTMRHPYPSDGAARRRYLEIGEIAFVSEKWPQIAAVFSADPGRYPQRMANRAVAALLRYHPYSEAIDARQWPSGISKWTHTMPLLAVVVLLFTQRGIGNDPKHRLAIAIFVLVLLPYIAVSYYDRYAAPLLTVKCLLVLYAIRAVADRIRSGCFLAQEQAKSISR